MASVAFGMGSCASLPHRLSGICHFLLLSRGLSLRRGRDQISEATSPLSATPPTSLLILSWFFSLNSCWLYHMYPFFMRTLTAHCFQEKELRFAYRNLGIPIT